MLSVILTRKLELVLHEGEGSDSIETRFVMEPMQKRLKTGSETTKNDKLNEKFRNSNESSFDGRNFEENHSSIQANIERAKIDPGNQQLPVCEDGVDCNKIDLIHFAEFWHPTKEEEHEGKEEKSKNGGCCYEEDECEVVELPCHELEATQQVFEEYSDSESDDELDENANTLRKSNEQQASAESLESQ